MVAADRQHIYQTIQTSLVHIPSYIGQEPLDDYCNRIETAISYTDTMIADTNTANANTFTDAHKADIYKSKMTE
ncbi:3337_t:CDS:1, partial [Ambispora gerdemannii]